MELQDTEGGPGPEILRDLGAEIELTLEQLAALACHRAAIYAERDALRRCHDLLRQARQQIQLHTQSFSHLMAELRSIFSPVQVHCPTLPHTPSHSQSFDVKTEPQAMAK
jgi:hypothetical protein